MRAVAVLAIVVLGVAPAVAEPILSRATPDGAAAPAWIVQYVAISQHGSIRSTRLVNVRPDGSLRWQQIDTETGIAPSAGSRHCAGSDVLNDGALDAVRDAARAIPASAAGERKATRGVSFALIVPSGSSTATTARTMFDPAAPAGDARLKTAYDVVARYGCAS